MGQTYETHKVASQDCKEDPPRLYISYAQADLEIYGLHGVEHYHEEEL